MNVAPPQTPRGRGRRLARLAGPLRPWPVGLGLALCLALYAFLSVREMALVGTTVDEPTYFNSGRVIANEGWEQPIVRLHGPIPYRMNQLFVGEFPAGGFQQAEHPEELLFRGRLGTLPFGLLGLVVTFLWAAALFGPVGGLVSAALYATSPLLVGYGGLLAVDVIHAATVLLSLYLLWRYVMRPGRGRLVLVGVGLGLAFATKYLALLNGPLVVLVAATRAAWAQRSRGAARIAGAWLGTAALISALAIGTLHATYGFGSDGFGSHGLGVGRAPRDATAYESELVASLVQLPVIGTFVTAFPRPYLLGADYQMSVGEGEHLRPFVDGRFASSHPTYYLRAFLWKTPEWTLLLTAWLLVFRLPAWLVGHGTLRRRAAAWVLLPPMLAALLYLSLMTGLQIGIRYVLPLYPMLFVLLGSVVTLRAVRRSPRVLGLGAALVLAFHGYDLARNWPNLIGYFNHAAGGQAHAFRHFRDSNAEWGQLTRPGLALLRAESSPFEVLSPFAGPRFGRVAIQVRDLVRPAPDDPSRTWHWLYALPFERHVGGAWWLYDVTPAALEDAAAKSADPRVRAALVVAYLGEGDVAAARMHLPRLVGERSARLRELADLIEAAQRDEPDTRALLRTIALWDAVGRHDRIEALARTAPALAEYPDRALALARAQLKQDHLDDAIATLRARGAARRPAETHLLAETLLHEKRYDEALEVLEDYLADAPRELAGPAEELAARVRAERAARRRFLEALR